MKAGSHLKRSIAKILLGGFLGMLTIADVSIAAPLAVKDSPPNLPNWPKPSPVPVLSAEDAIKTMKLPSGFRMEVVACEPMIEHPVQARFDADGRLWVVEMRSYMPNVQGKGESQPTGRISILEDTDGDGLMDKVTVFMDHLVLPRAVCPVRGGALVAVPPNLLFCRDTNGDGKADQQTIVETDYGLRGNPEHQPNGLLPALDNWIYSANYTRRLRWIDGTWVAETVPELGQWGISQDNFGRLFHDTNTDQLRGSLIPPSYADRNPHYRAHGADLRIAQDQTVWPAHPTAVDRGYLKGTIMRDNGTLRDFTAACAPTIYRGALFPKDFDGNAFVCEPAANLIKRDLLSESTDGSLVAKNAYEKREFLSSTYERFRPVNLTVGPDGALYVVDMHHGLIQHKTYLTTYCEDQYLQRNLQSGMETGRIYRIVPITAKPSPPPHLSTTSTAELVKTLSHPNGWWRDMAQRLLVERGDYKAIPLLRKTAKGDPDPLARLHALWALEGFRISDPSVIASALTDSDPMIRASGIRLSEPLLGNAHARARIMPEVMKLASDPQPDVQLQFALTVGGLGLPQTDSATLALLAKYPDRPLLRDAVITGLRGRELEYLRALLASGSWSAPSAGAKDVLTALSRCIVVENRPKRVAQLLDLIAAESSAQSGAWRATALLKGFAQPHIPPRMPRRILLASQPTQLLDVQQSARGKLKEDLKDLQKLVHWPGQPGYTPPPPPPPLTPDQQARYEHGKQVYARTCIACHKADGFGQEGTAPPLVDSEWVLGPPGRIARIVLNGLTGPVTVEGKTYALDMPSLGSLSDDDIASVLTYVRREWEHGASPVDPSEVARIRATTRPIAWTERELLQVR
jgi:mono/diheme cytochrome c family protein/glucose/arabinose dehydrogenase